MAVRASSSGHRVSAHCYCSIFTGGSSAIKASYNTSSITEHNSSTYEITFSSAAGDTNYCVAVNVDVETNQWAQNIGGSSFRVVTGGGLGSSIVNAVTFKT